MDYGYAKFAIKNSSSYLDKWMAVFIFDSGFYANLEWFKKPAAVTVISFCINLLGKERAILTDKIV